MSDSIAVALISGLVSLVATIITVVASSHKTQAKVQKETQDSQNRILMEFQAAKGATEKAQAITDTKIEQLKEEVRVHNHFAQRMPVIEEQIKVINHRLDDLERS